MPPKSKASKSTRVYSMTKPAKSKAKWRVKRYTGMAKVLSAKSRSITTKPKSQWSADQPGRCRRSQQGCSSARLVGEVVLDRRAPQAQRPACEAASKEAAASKQGAVPKVGSPPEEAPLPNLFWAAQERSATSGDFGLLQWVNMILHLIIAYTCPIHFTVCMYVCMHAWMDGWMGMDACMHVWSRVPCSRERELGGPYHWEGARDPESGLIYTVYIYIYHCRIQIQIIQVAMWVLVT